MHANFLNDMMVMFFSKLLYPSQKLVEWLKAIMQIAIVHF
jgi:hypothetical protein